MISVHSYHVTVGLLYLTVAGMAKTRMRDKMCNCAPRLIEHSSEQTIVCIRASISFIAKFIPFLAVFNQLTLGEDIEKIPGPSYVIEMFKLGTLNLLSVDDLPCSARLCEREVPVRVLNLLTSRASVAVGHAFLKKFIPSNDDVSMLFFMGGETIAIIQKKINFGMFLICIVEMKELFLSQMGSQFY